MLDARTRFVGKSVVLALATSLIAAVPASAKDPLVRSDQPRAQAAVPVGNWSGYRPGTAWGTGTAIANGRAPSQSAASTRPSVTTYYVAQSGWVACTPAATWSPGARTDVQARDSVPASGWTGYDPASSWRAYRIARGWQDRQSRGPIAVRPLRMQHAHNPGPSPYADGLARNYYEYGTGRPVPLAKPWLPGAP